MMMKKQQRKSYSPELKVKIALEAIGGHRTINEIASHYLVHPNQLSRTPDLSVPSARGEGR